MLRFKVDENLPRETVDLLNGCGHDAITVGDQGMSGSSDLSVAEICKSERRAIVTLDLDFADIRTFRPIEYCGIIVFRLARLDEPYVLAAVRRFLPILDQDNPAGKLWIVDESSVRIRD